MQGNTLITIIAGILILACIIVAIVIRLKAATPSEYDKSLAENFLKKLSDVFYEKIINIINNIDFAKYSSLTEMEIDVLNQIYASIWEFVESELEEQAKTDVLTALAIKVLNKEYVDKFVEGMLDKYRVSDIISKSWDKNIETIQEKDVVSEDASLQNKFMGNDYYEEVSQDQLPPAEKIEPTEEELANLNPPKEEDDETYNPDDESMEIVGEDDDDTYIDSAGRRRSKTTGRFV